MGDTVRFYHIHGNNLDFVDVKRIAVDINRDDIAWSLQAVVEGSIKVERCSQHIIEYTVDLHCP